MKKYNSYKDSGIEWMGIIPSNWKLIKNRYGFQKHKNGKNESDDTSVLSLTIKGVKVKINLNFGKSTESYIGHQLVEEGDIVFTPRDFDQTPILSDVSKYNGCISNLYIVDKTKEDVLNHYVNYYWYGLKYSVDYFKNFSHGMRYSFNRFQFDEIPLLKPPLSEQQQIVSFLDTKTSLIDSLIEKTQRKIELLKEKRTSLINEVVTKGLNPNVEMKDSGVEWIGEIPSHWEFVRIGHLNRVVRGGSPRPSGDPRFFNGDFIHWITVKDITSKTGKYVTTTDTKLTEEGMKQSRVLEPETLVLTNSGVTLGIPGILKIRGCINDGSVSFLDMSPKIERDYLYYFWTTQTELLLEQQSGYGQPNLNIEIVSNVRFPLPPLSEQQQIVEYLDEQTGLIDKTISIEEKRIELLKEYRQSLISEVVTGKRKVV
jgi:type I restriction enzyme S subunit